MHAQSVISASGGKAVSGFGEINYVVGQMVYSKHVGTNNNYIIEGVQQPFEISTTLEVASFENSAVKLFAYPNPTSSFLILDTTNFTGTNLSFKIVDTLGKLIKSNNITTSKTKIEMMHLESAIYFLTIFNANNKIKTFKIKKNN